MRCAGLLLIIKPNKVVLLCARQSYNGGELYHNYNALRKANFLEKLSIPRGKRDGNDSFDYETAIREFIEETGKFFECATVHKVPFVLQWNDNGAVYKYSIYVGILSGALKNVALEPNTFCVKLKNHTQPNSYKINIESRKHNSEIQRHLYILPLADYFKYMHEKQLTTYNSSNYLDFFNFVKDVKTKFDDGRMSDFFLISLKLDNFDLFTKWTHRRSKIILATRQELMKIVNIV
ncbi:ADPRase [Erannis ankeraria nucleopolyhedrovirus]|uniref:ADPRase n=1 Tax=Erannis ankeraria nucleopolyhedrovirus TaxID=2913600 RepID=UPI002481CA9B|nr:ADPRase [Erannis ankeraria nucleopolyhedrovirus]UJZ88976.1 ADPRase [Erannis ankeraria nucleopolyhedrovirus]